MYTQAKIVASDVQSMSRVPLVFAEDTYDVTVSGREQVGRKVVNAVALVTNVRRRIMIKNVVIDAHERERNIEA